MHTYVCITIMIFIILFLYVARRVSLCIGNLETVKFIEFYSKSMCYKFKFRTVYVRHAKLYVRHVFPRVVRENQIILLDPFIIWVVLKTLKNF